MSKSKKSSDSSMSNRADREAPEHKDPVPEEVSEHKDPVPEPAEKYFYYKLEKKPDIYEIPVRSLTIIPLLKSAYSGVKKANSRLKPLTLKNMTENENFLSADEYDENAKCDHQFIEQYAEMWKISPRGEKYIKKPSVINAHNVHVLKSIDKELIDAFLAKKIALMFSGNVSKYSYKHITRKLYCIRSLLIIATQYLKMKHLGYKLAKYITDILQKTHIDEIRKALNDKAFVQCMESFKTANSSENKKVIQKVLQ